MTTPHLSLRAKFLSSSDSITITQFYKGLVLVLLVPAYLLAGFVWGGWIVLRDLWWADVHKAMTKNDDDDDQEEDLARVVTTGSPRVLPYRSARRGRSAGLP